MTKQFFNKGHFLNNAHSNNRNVKNIKNKPVSLSVLALTVSSILLSGCGDKTSEPAVPQTSQVSVKVAKADGALVTSVTVPYRTVTTQQNTNADGFANVINLPAGERIVLNVARKGFAKQVLVENLQADEKRSFVDVELLKLTTAVNLDDANEVTGKIDIGTGGRFASSSNTSASKTVTVSIAPNSINRVDASDTNPLLLSVTNVDVSKETELPGDMKTFENETLTPVEVISAAHIFLGNAVNLSGEQLASFSKPIDISIPANGKIDATADLYAFDERLGLWQKDSTLTLNADKTAYTGQTTKTGYLGIVQPIAVANLSGCVQDATGKKLKRAVVILTGDDYSGYDKVLTDDQGFFNIRAKQGGDVSVFAKVGQYKSNVEKVKDATSQRIQPSDSSNDSGNNSNTALDSSCMLINTGTDDAKVSGLLSWNPNQGANQGKLDYDINILLPNGVAITHANRIYSDEVGRNLVITENSDDVSENISYLRLMQGNHYIFASNFFYDFTTPMSASGIKLLLGNKTFTPPTGEITNKDNPLVDNRTAFWLAAIMKVTAPAGSDACEVSIEKPDDSYQAWLKDYQFSRGKIFKDTDKTVLSEATKTPVFCKTVTIK